jgi:hypothetical protein
MKEISRISLIFCLFNAAFGYAESKSTIKTSTTVTTTTKSAAYKNLLPPPSADSTKVEVDPVNEAAAIEERRRVKSDLNEQNKADASKPDSSKAKDGSSKSRVVVGATCTDTNGRSYTSGDEGYDLCIQNTMNSGQNRKNPEMDGRINAEPKKSNVGPGFQIKLGK